MSIEALNWARKIYVGDALAKALLRGISDYADENGHCFPSHARLALDCEMSVATIKRRLAQLEELDLLVTFRCWQDEHGVRNRERRGRETSREIRLALDKRIEPPAPQEEDVDGPDDDAGGGANSTPSNQNEGVPIAPHGVLPAPPGESLLHPPRLSEPPSNLKDSPLPPSGGEGDLEGWKEFEEDWAKHGFDRPEPIIRQSIAQRIWAALKPEERVLAQQAARGYVAHRKAQKNPLKVMGAQTFLRERGAWEKLAKLAPEVAATTTSRSSLPADSVEADAIRALYAVARAHPFEHRNRVSYRGEVTTQLLKFAEAGPQSGWPWIELGRAIASWSEFLDQHVHVARPPLVIKRLVDGDERRGIFAPWMFPPSVEGKLYPITGPPEVLMTEADEAEEFR